MKTVLKHVSPYAIRRVLYAVARRFPFPLAYISALVAWLVFILYGHALDGNINESVCWVLFEGFLMSLAANLWCEFMNRNRAIRIAQIFILGFVVVDFIVLWLRGGVAGSAEFIGRAAITTAFAAAILFLPSVKHLDTRQLWYYTVWQLSSVAVAVFISAVMAVSCLIIFTSINILFGIDEYKPMLTAMYVSAIWIPMVVYLSRLPKLRDVKRWVLSATSPIGAFSKNVMLPLVGVYIIILYVYAAKILFTWELPKASISWMVTGLMSVSLIMLYGLQRYLFEDRFPPLTVRICVIVRNILPIALIPLLVLMSIGLVYRIGEYGITVSRLYVAAFNIWAYYVVLYLVFRKSANLNIVAVSFAVVFAAVSIIPGLNFTSIADRFIRSELIKSLKARGVDSFPISDEKLTEILSGMDKKDAENMASRVEYLDDWNDHSRISDIVVSDSKMSSWSILPEKYNVLDTVVEVVEPSYAFLLQCDESIDIPDTYTKVSKKTFYGTKKFQTDSCGFATIEFDGYYAKINADSLISIKESKVPLILNAINSDGEACCLVFTYMHIDNDDVSEIVRPQYYLFTR